jgi:hypothetical protein
VRREKIEIAEKNREGIHKKIRKFRKKTTTDYAERTPIICQLICTFVIYL